MIITGFGGAELRLQVAEETQQIVSAMLIKGDSALELGAYAAPRSGGLWPELREEIIEAATEAGGSAALVEGPFGVELRRLLPVTTPDGEQGYQPSRMWVVEGPRWLLRGILYGQAALEEHLDPPVADLLTAFREVVVRRGEEAKSPGDLLPLVIPPDVEPGPEGAGKLASRAAWGAVRAGSGLCRAPAGRLHLRRRGAGTAAPDARLPRRVPARHRGTADAAGHESRAAGAGRGGLDQCRRSGCPGRGSASTRSVGSAGRPSSTGP